MVFGAMGIMNTEFARRLATQTNFTHVVPLFNARLKRCFFERLLYCIVTHWQPVGEWRLQSVCGCIFKHQNSFHNVIPDEHLANNPYIVKCWQGR
jgi:hypothetical protein